MSERGQPEARWWVESPRSKSSRPSIRAGRAARDGNRNSEVADLRNLGGPVLVGDCDRNGRVVINELVLGVNIALGQTPVSECTPFDRVPNGRVTVDELIRGVRNALLSGG